LQYAGMVVLNAVALTFDILEQVLDLDIVAL
jgi:hypothetical protein